jgi:hypothetical protein
MLPCLLLGASLALGQTDALAPGALPPVTRGDAGDLRVPSQVHPEQPKPADAGMVAPAALNLWPMAAQPEQTELEVFLPQPSPAKGEGAPEPKPVSASQPKRRALPSPFDSPPFPGSEYQGYPLIGVPSDFTIWPAMKFFQGTPIEDFLLTNHTRVFGWVTSEANLSTSTRSNTPDSYWIRPNNADLDQAVLVIQKTVDTVQTDHIDWGFRSVVDYGIDYRYFTAGGWFSDQLLRHNSLYGWDATEQYFEVYIPGVAQGMMVRVGRWIACPDIETQYAPDNYLGSHSLLFTFDTYTQTGVMLTFKLSDQWLVQAVLHSGTDMAPWYKGAIPTGAFGVRWVAASNNDAFYTWLNAINDAKFRRFQVGGQPAGHDNFNYLVSTWEHRFNRQFITKTESYIMWQRDAVVGGTPSLGPVHAFGGGGIGADIPGTTLTFGVLNYTVYQLNARDYMTVRNEWWKDTDGERSGFASTYTSNSIGYSHFITPNLLFRPELSYFRSWTVPAFDNGRRKNEAFLAFDFTFRF